MLVHPFFILMASGQVFALCDLVFQRTLIFAYPETALAIMRSLPLSQNDI